MKNPLVSIIIVNWNRKEDLLFVLKKIHEDNTYENIEVIIVDNGSDDGSIIEVPKKYPNFKYINLSSNLGCEEGYNIGVLNSSGEILIYLDSDAYIEKGGIKKMVKIFNRDSEIGIIDPIIINYHSNLPQNTPKNWPLYGTMFTGCAVALKMELINKIGLRPANFFIYASEADVCIRTLDAGYKIWHAKDIKAYHMESPVKRLSSKFFYYSTRNIIWLIFKYYPIFPAIRELFVHLLWNLILALKSFNLYQYFKGVISGLYKLPKIIKNERKVLKNWKLGRIYPSTIYMLKILKSKIK